MVSTVECLQLCLNRPLFQRVRGGRPPLGSSRENTVGGGLRNLRRVCFAQSGVPVLAAHAAVTRHLVCAVKSTCSPEELLLSHSRTAQGQGGKSELLYFLCLSFIICPPPPRPHTNPQRRDTHETSRPFCLAASQDPRGAEKLTGTHGRARWATPCAFLNSCANKLE